jgi:hypothetical protein
MAFAQDEVPCNPENRGAPFDASQLNTLASANRIATINELQVNMNQLMSDVGPAARNAGLKDRVKIPVVIHDRPPTEVDYKRIMHPNFESPNDAGLILAFRPPSDFSMKDCGQNRASFTSSSGNSMVHNQHIYGPDNKARYQRVDAIGQVNEVKYERTLEPGDCVSSLTVSARFFDATSGANSLSPMEIFTGDRAIEKFHRKLGYNDPYWRRRLGYDQLGAQLVDPNGNTFSLDSKDENTVFIMPIRVSYDRYKRLTQSENSKTTLNYGVQSQIPVSSPFGQAAVGVHANVVNTDRISENWLATFAAGISMNVQRNVFGGYNPSDRTLTPTYNATVATGLTRVDKDRKGQTSVIFTVGRGDSLFKQNEYYSYVPNESSYYLSQQSRAAMMDPELSFGLAIVRESGNSTVQFECKEDYNKRFKGFNGNNNQDWFCSISKNVKF